MRLTRGYVPRPSSLAPPVSSPDSEAEGRGELLCLPTRVLRDVRYQHSVWCYQGASARGGQGGRSRGQQYKCSRRTTAAAVQL
eukprot:2132251-Rhodomonas_salina.1